MTQASIALNPLREGLTMERAAEACALIIFGAHGDLAKRKLIPALYALFVQGLLPHNFCILGTSRTQLDNDKYRTMMKDSVQKYAPDIEVEEDSWGRFADLLYYMPGDTGKHESFSEMARLLEDLGGKHGTGGNNIFYLSTPPSLYSPIVMQLAAAGLAVKKPGKAPFPRVVVEKPFGRDLGSARALNAELHEVLEEQQVFRIDHYLGKETVQNIMVLRFANSIFEPLWNRHYVDHVQITNAETLGVEDRATYYEEAGALRDMIQNHMLQLISLVAMEPPISLEADAIRDERAKVIKSIRPFDKDDLESLAIRGQYGSGWVLGQEVPGYRQEKGVSPESRTETFAALKLYVDNWRWADVPFYVRSGKRLAKGITEIAIHFRKAPHKLFSEQLLGGTGGGSPNVLVMQIQPDEGISLKFATKLPGPTTQLRWLSMDFRYSTAFGVRSPSAYERLLLDCLVGDASLFARSDQVESSWEFLAPVLERWAETKPSFPNYAAGSWGPQASHDLMAADGREWRRL
jgi:glucose-6-phosphate 1-dehydrogenase